MRLRSIAVLSAAPHDLPRKALSSKLEHGEVHYGKGMPRAHCSICKHYVPPPNRDDKPHCDIVVDPIRPSDWCDRFAK